MKLATAREVIKKLGRKLGFNLVSRDRLGVDVDLDLLRLTVSDPLRTIFDVGGNFGQTAVHLASAFPGSRVHTFEPVPSSFQRLQESVAHRPAISCHHLAIGDRAGMFPIHVTEDAETNSFLANDNSTDHLDVPMDTLDGFTAANRIEFIDLLKIDVEGYELPVLKGAENLLRRQAVRYIYAECVFSTDTELPHTSFFELHTVLEGFGFCFVNYYPMSFRLAMGSALGNVLYALRSKLPQSAPGEVHNIT